MADKFLTSHAVKAGSTSVSVLIVLRSAVDTGNGAAAITGIAHTDLTSASYLRQGGERVAITLAALSNVDDAYSSGGWIEIDSTNMPGVYRLDVPDAAFATGADWVAIQVADGGTLCEPLVIALPTYGNLADAVLDTVVESEGSYTAQQVLSIALAVLAGRTSNGGLTFATPNNAATRVTAATDSSKNRTSMTLAPSS